MNLADKGRYAPPPHLPAHAQAVSNAISRWWGVQARTHWLLGDETQVDGADFYVGERELGHVHLDGEAHLAVEKPLRDALIAARLATPFRWSQGFVVCRIGSSATASTAQALFRLAYDRLQGESIATILGRIKGLAETSAVANA
jgi:Family of unknown function (DUF5519)